MTELLPPDYAMHDLAYTKRRANKQPGWESSDSSVYDDMLRQVLPVLSALPAAPDGQAPAVLEIGCGAGNLTVELAARGYRMSGVDISPTATDWARERAAASGLTVNFKVGDVVTLTQWPDACLDAVIDGHCLHCIIGADRARCLQTLHRILKPAGLLLVQSMCGDTVPLAMLPNFDAATRLMEYNKRPTRYIGQASAIEAEVSAAGFAVLERQVIAAKDANDLDELILLVGKR